MQKINLDFIKKNHNNKIIINNNNEKDNNKKLIKDIKFYKKRIKEYNISLLNLFINNNEDKEDKEDKEENKINNLNKKHIELYKTYLENLIKYFKFIDCENQYQKELENYNNSNNINIPDISNNYIATDKNILLEYKINKKNSIKKYCETNKIHEEPKILPKKKIIHKYNGKTDAKKKEIS